MKFHVVPCPFVKEFFDEEKERERSKKVLAGRRGGGKRGETFSSIIFGGKLKYL